MPKASREVGKGEGMVSSVGVRVGEEVEVGVAVSIAVSMRRSVGVWDGDGWTGWMVGLVIIASVWGVPFSDVQAARDAASTNPRIPVITQVRILNGGGIGDIFFLHA
jgi:hypothetical protein